MKKILIFIFVYLLFCGIPLSSAQEVTILPQNEEMGKVLPANEMAVNAAAGPAAGLLKTESFKLHFVRPQSVADHVRELMGPSQGGVIVNEQTLQLEVSAPSEIMEKIRSLILSLDKDRDVMIDVKIVQVDLNEEHLLGINWSAIVSDYKSFTTNEDKRKVSAGTVSNEDLAVLLEALETVGEMHEFPFATVRINNGQEADLRLKAFDRDVTVTMSPIHVPDANVSEKQDRYTARIVLSPTVGMEDAVDFRIAAIDGSAITVHVKNNTVAVIGGIFTQTKSESTKKFPFLGDLPLLGVVFRDQSKVVHRLENIIFLTPHVITPLTSATSK